MLYFIIFIYKIIQKLFLLPEDGSSSSIDSILKSLFTLLFFVIGGEARAFFGGPRGNFEKALSFNTLSSSDGGFFAVCFLECFLLVVANGFNGLVPPPLRE